MANQLVTFAEVAADIKAELDTLSPAELAAAVYGMQTSMGGFPRDLAQEKLICNALKAERLATPPGDG